MENKLDQNFLEKDLLVIRESKHSIRGKSLSSSISRFWHKNSRNCCCFWYKSKTNENNEKVESYFGHFRYIILLVSVLCMAATKSNEVSFNFTIICMTSNSTVNNDEPIPLKPKQISAIFAGSGIGAIVIVFPVVYALHYLGPQIVFSGLLMLSALGTMFLPTLGRWSPLWMVLARIMQGLALSAVLPLMGCISAQWAPIEEISKFMTLLSSASQVSQIITTPLSAKLCVTLGWSSVYHMHGIVSAFLATIFFIVFRSTPGKHPCVSPKELQYITAGAKARSKHESVPYLQIIKSKAVWAIWIAFLGNSFGFQLIVQFMPTFLNKVLHVPITRTGIAAIIPPLTQLIVKVCAGWVCDKITWINELRKMQISNTIAMIGCGFFFLPLGFLPTISEQKSVQQVIALLCFTSSISCLGLVACGSMKSATLIARDFSHFVMAVVQLIVCIGMLLVPIIVSLLAPGNTIAEWRSVFFLVFTVLTLSDIFFCNFCSADVEPWAVRKFKNVDYSEKLLILKSEENDLSLIADVKHSESNEKS